MSLAVILHDDCDCLVPSVIRHALEGLALVHFTYRPLVGSGFGEGYRTKAGGVTIGILGYRYIRSIEYGSIAHRRDRELEAVRCRPLTAIQHLLDLDLAFGGCSRIRVRQRDDRSFVLRDRRCTFLHARRCQRVVCDQRFRVRFSNRILRSNGDVADCVRSVGEVRIGDDCFIGAITDREAQPAHVRTLRHPVERLCDLQMSNVLRVAIGKNKAHRSAVLDYNALGQRIVGIVVNRLIICSNRLIIDLDFGYDRRGAHINTSDIRSLILLNRDLRFAVIIKDDLGNARNTCYLKGAGNRHGSFILIAWHRLVLGGGGFAQDNFKCESIVRIGTGTVDPFSQAEAIPLGFVYKGGFSNLNKPNARRSASQSRRQRAGITSIGIEGTFIKVYLRRLPRQNFLIIGRRTSYFDCPSNSIESNKCVNLPAVRSITAARLGGSRNYAAFGNTVHIPAVVHFGYLSKIDRTILVLHLFQLVPSIFFQMVHREGEYLPGKRRFIVHRFEYVQIGGAGIRHLRINAVPFSAIIPHVSGGDDPSGAGAIYYCS